MLTRWRGRATGLAILFALTLVGAEAPREPRLTVHGPAGVLLVTGHLPGGEFSLRYRNSLYGSLTVERYVIDHEGHINLVGLFADELAVLEEYYVIDEPARRAAAGQPGNWHADPARPVRIGELIVAATDLGRRTLLIDDAEPVALWRLVSDLAPSVTLRAVQP